jgi:hypothetical protein
VWAGEHVRDLLIYPLAVASAVMAVPSMATYGTARYGYAYGAVLPVLSELGMWAFAVAVTFSRRLHPDRPVWALQLGLVVFAGAGFGINLGHGLSGGPLAGVVMGFASIAGVVAHQLVTAAPRRSAVERAEIRIERTRSRKTARIRRAAVRHAVAEIDAHGSVTLVYAPPVGTRSGGVDGSPRRPCQGCRSIRSKTSATPSGTRSRRGLLSRVTPRPSTPRLGPTGDRSRPSTETMTCISRPPTRKRSGIPDTGPWMT